MKYGCGVVVFLAVSFNSFAKNYLPIPPLQYISQNTVLSEFKTRFCDYTSVDLSSEYPNLTWVPCYQGLGLTDLGLPLVNTSDVKLLLVDSDFVFMSSGVHQVVDELIESGSSPSEIASFRNKMIQFTKSYEAKDKVLDYLSSGSAVSNADAGTGAVLLSSTASTGRCVIKSKEAEAENQKIREAWQKQKVSVAKAIGCFFKSLLGIQSPDCPAAIKVLGSAGSMTLSTLVPGSGYVLMGAQQILDKQSFFRRSARGEKISITATLSRGQCKAPVSPTPSPTTSPTPSPSVSAN